MGVIRVERGQLATVVTALEMTARPRPKPLPASPFRLVRWAPPKPAAYRALFRRVGERWLWYSRLLLDDAGLLAQVAAPAIEVHAVVDARGVEIGLLELDFSVAGECRLAFFGLVPELAGKGHGRWLMAHALALGWRKGITRMWVQTCSLDHPHALGFYRAQGFTAYDRIVETFADPRLAGLLPREAAPQIPLLGEPLASCA